MRLDSLDEVQRGRSVSAVASSEAIEWARAAGSFSASHLMLTNSAESPRNVSFNGLSSFSLKSSRCNFVSDWDFDTFRIDEISKGAPLTYVLEGIFRHNSSLLGAHTALVGDVRSYISEVGSTYNDNVSDVPAYHNSVHAADVTQALHYFLRGPPALWDSLVRSHESHTPLTSNPPLLFLGAIVAAAVHDYEHPGRNGDFLLRTNHPWISEYGSESVLERHHCAAAFRLMDSMNLVSSHMTFSEFKEWKQLIVEMVLSTDLSRHASIVSEPFDPTRHISRSLGQILHTADVSNVARALDVSLKWTDRLFSELFDQGELEGMSGLSISPLMDRETANIGRIQIGFIDVISRPLFCQLDLLLRRLNPDNATTGLDACLANLDNLRDFWRRLVDADQAKLDSEHLSAIGGTLGEERSTFLSLSPPVVFADQQMALRSLTNRRVISVSGQGTYAFLQGLVTQDMNIFKEKSGAIASLFLSSKGRVLTDCLISKSQQTEEESVLIDLPVSIAESTANLLVRHKLRLPLTIQRYDEQELSVGYSLNEGGGVADQSGVRSAYVDPRSDKLPTRAIFDPSMGAEEIVSEEDSVYRRIRMMLGIVEFDDIPTESIPIFYNFDLFNCISFNKGCYTGQELVTRTLRRGLVRRRTIPVQAVSTGGECRVSIGDKVELAGKEIGSVFASEGDVGLALVQFPDESGLGFNNSVQLCRAIADSASVVVTIRPQSGGEPVGGKILLPSYC